METGLLDDKVYISYLIIIKNTVKAINQEMSKECLACKFFEENDEDSEDLKCICRDKNQIVELFTATLWDIIDKAEEREKKYETKDES